MTTEQIDNFIGAFYEHCTQYRVSMTELEIDRLLAFILTKIQNE